MNECSEVASGDCVGASELAPAEVAAAAQVAAAALPAVAAGGDPLPGLLRSRACASPSRRYGRAVAMQPTSGNGSVEHAWTSGLLSKVAARAVTASPEQRGVGCRAQEAPSAGGGGS